MRTNPEKIIVMSPEPPVTPAQPRLKHFAHYVKRLRAIERGRVTQRQSVDDFPQDHLVHASGAIAPVREGEGCCDRASEPTL